jgi:hypothetical protein
MKNILIALDYNPSSETVAETGYAIAKAMRAELTFIHVITEPQYYVLEYPPFMRYRYSNT